VVVGAGWIGPEVAAAARQRGATVTVVERSRLPSLRVFDRNVARVFADLHRDHGVTFRFGGAVQAFRGAGRGNHREVRDAVDRDSQSALDVTTPLRCWIRPGVDRRAAAGRRPRRGCSGR
jgi:NADPH-dependent 2,4-dienoyl-CoA reductase/sulfur reductase-like enzyme